MFPHNMAVSLRGKKGGEPVSSTLEDLTQSQEDVNPTVIDIKQDKNGLNYIEVSCGELTDALYLEKLRQLGSKGHEKCILYEETMLIPQEFETMGGKKANKAWKKSIKHKNKPLSKFVSSGVLKEHAGDSLSPGSSQLV